MNYLVIPRNLYSRDRYKRASLILIKGIQKNKLHLRLFLASVHLPYSYSLLILLMHYVTQDGNLEVF